MLNFDHNIGFWEKRQFFCRKLAKIAENCDHNIGPWSFSYWNIFHTLRKRARLGRALQFRNWVVLRTGLRSTDTLHPGGIRSQDPSGPLTTKIYVKHYLDNVGSAQNNVFQRTFWGRFNSRLCQCTLHNHLDMNVDRTPIAKFLKYISILFTFLLS
jgi:hypothetical protein